MSKASSVILVVARAVFLRPGDVREVSSDAFLRRDVATGVCPNDNINAGVSTVTMDVFQPIVSMLVFLL